MPIRFNFNFALPNLEKNLTGLFFCSLLRGIIMPIRFNFNFALAQSGQLPNYTSFIIIQIHSRYHYYCTGHTSNIHCTHTSRIFYEDWLKTECGQRLYWTTYKLVNFQYRLEARCTFRGEQWLCTWQVGWYGLPLQVHQYLNKSLSHYWVTLAMIKAGNNVTIFNRSLTI